ncbi:MAG: hypothetical protein U1F35_10360 [Steroidobacteraceae bacterium]
MALAAQGGDRGTPVAPVRELFSIDHEVLLYDVTSTYFEGEAKGNALPRAATRVITRPDCKQVCIALVVSLMGFRWATKCSPAT